MTSPALQPLGIDEDTATKYLSAYLREAAVSTALWRSIEAGALSTVTLTPPVLDIGCGFGEFARLFFGDRAQPEIGIDIDRGELLRAAAVQPSIYGSILQGDARRLPFPDATFGSVISISTMEHIPGVDATLAEAARLLRPGGVLAMTVPMAPMSDNLVGHRILRLASAKIADRYANALHRQLTHVNVWPAQRWLDLVQGTGLTIERACATVSPGATRVFEAMLPAAFANRMFRYATGHRPPHPEPFVRLARRLLRGQVMAASADGSNLFIVARKGAA